jgi:hypothetical protein
MGTGTTAGRSWAGWVLATAMVAGAAGVSMSLAGVHSPVRTTLVLLFLAVAPTTAIYGLLGSFDPFARIILACTVSVVFLTLTATVMLAEGMWSPTGGLLAVAGITAVCLLAQWAPVRQRVAAKLAAWRSATRVGVGQTNAVDKEAE